MGLDIEMTDKQFSKSVLGPLTKNEKRGARGRHHGVSMPTKRTSEEAESVPGVERTSAIA